MPHLAYQCLVEHFSNDVFNQLTMYDPLKTGKNVFSTSRPSVVVAVLRAR